MRRKKRRRKNHPNYGTFDRIKEEKENMVQSSDGIKQSKNTITNNIIRMAQMKKQVLTENQYLA